jgi:hypothetical protein
MILKKGRRNAEMDRYRQLQTPLQQLTHESGNDIRNKNKNNNKMYLDLTDVQLGNTG